MTVLKQCTLLSFFYQETKTKAPDELQNWARTVSYTGTDTLGEIGALACSYEQVKLRSLNQEPNVMFGPVLYVQVSDNGGLATHRIPTPRSFSTHSSAQKNRPHSKN